MAPTDSTAASPPAWGVQHTLCLPTEDAARQAAAELAALGHRLIAIRAHDHVRSDPSSFWYGMPSLDPELTGWWQVFSLAVHTGHDRRALEPFLRHERIRIAGVARSHGGFRQGGAEGHATTLHRAFTRDGVVHERATAEVTPPAPLPADPAPPALGPRWTGPASGGPDRPDRPEDVVRAVVAVAERMYGGANAAPDAVGWLLDEDFAFGEPYETTGAFLGDLADAVAPQGTCTDDTVEAVPFLAELAHDGDIPPSVRLIVLGDLLQLAATGASLAVSAADRIAALGAAWQEPAGVQMTRRAIGRALPRLLDRWDEEADAARFVLAALAAAAPHDAGTHLVPRLNVLPAPEGSPRADTVALIAALLDHDERGLDTALHRLTSWRPALAEQTTMPHAAPRQVALAVLPALVMEDVGPAVHS
ncbi:hypothetical protein [Streptomyces sp. ME19-01-6]|uniref:hypothetical protein n=1 Tax=Streptomyces sp. ME19-01-6 TaxID=3028686 RepID=UPI0029A66737|nr:hypothetical protein [Streptomyces sp. ME19-01-6]MDX3226150.1 hypothetical protein [Streptomyces sp. ME19-01-6]